MTAPTEALLELMSAWDEVDHAAQRVATALPSQISEAVEKLDAARLKMRAQVNQFARLTR